MQEHQFEELEKLVAEVEDQSADIEVCIEIHFIRQCILAAQGPVEAVVEGWKQRHVGEVALGKQHAGGRLQVVFNQPKERLCCSKNIWKHKYVCYHASYRKKGLLD